MAPIQRLRRDTDDPGLRRTGINGVSIRMTVIADRDLPVRIEKAIGRRVPSDIRMEAFNDMYADQLEGILPVSQIETAAPRYRSRAFEMAGFNHSTRSIDEKDENGLSLADMLAEPEVSAAVRRSAQAQIRERRLTG